MTGTAPTSPLTRILHEGYGSGAWHGPDLKAALSDVDQAAALQRPGTGRHNIAEIALHHAYCIRGVRAQLSGGPAEPFVLPGEDWFPVDSATPLAWAAIKDVVESEQRALATAVAALAPGDPDQFGLVLGATCHAVYHAGQIQLIKRLAS